MVKQLIATLVTNSNGEAFYNYTGTGAGQTTFIAESGELESNSLTINDINQELTITADKNILSYADNDTATLTATLTKNNNPIQGENIYIYNNPDNIEFDQMLYGPLYYPCIRLKLEGDGVMTFPGGRGLIINLYNNNNQYIDSMGLSTEKWSIISSNGEILLKNETQNYTTNFASFTQYFIIEIGINAQNQTDYPTITSSTFSTFIETITTDSNGVATYTYNSQGVGDVTITAECMNLQETYELQDIYFARITEYSATKNDGFLAQKFIDDSTSLVLPSNFEMEFKYKTTGGTSSAEMRLFIMPRSLYVSDSQPSFAWFIGDTGCFSWEFGCRRDGSTSSVHKSTLTCNEWHTVKFTQSSENTRVYCYVDGNYFDYYILSDISNYSDYCFCFHNWANGTLSIKDITIKEL